MFEPNRLTPDQVSNIRSTFGRRETASGVSFELYSDSYLFLQPPIWDSGQPPESVMRWYERRYGPIGRAEYVKEKKGGCGIWHRTLPKIELVLPTVTQELAQARGQVLYLGNGLSDVPLLSVERFKRGELNCPPVIVDMFSYHALMQDFVRLNEVLHSLSVAPSSLINFTEFYTKLSSLVLACNSGFLNPVEYFVGSGQAPQILNNSSLIINCFGPSVKTLPEQLSFLALGGKLLTTHGLVLVPPEFRLESLGSGSAKITRVI